MKLYKNVDLCDLESILEKGILSADECLNYWENSNRANNSTSVVYLFQPVSNLNTFVQYGLVLLEVEVEDAFKTEFVCGDINKDKYIEYVVDKVLPNQITKIIIPKIFRDRIISEKILSDNVLNNVFWCDIIFDEKILTTDSFSQCDKMLELDKERIDKFSLFCGLNTYQNYLYCYIDVPFKTCLKDCFTGCFREFTLSYKVFYEIKISCYVF